MVSFSCTRGFVCQLGRGLGCGFGAVCQQRRAAQGCGDHVQGQGRGMARRSGRDREVNVVHACRTGAGNVTHSGVITPGNSSTRQYPHSASYASRHSHPASDITIKRCARLTIGFTVHDVRVAMEFSDPSRKQTAIMGKSISRA